MNTAASNAINNSSDNFIAAATNHKPKSLLIKHMQQYLKMNHLSLDGKTQLLYELLTNFSEDGFKLQFNASIKEVDIMVALDKLSLLSSLFFNLKVILSNDLKNMQAEMVEELNSLKLKLEILLLGMKQDQSGYIALASLLNQLSKFLDDETIYLIHIHEIETKLESIIESYSLNIFQGIQTLQEKGIKTRYLLSDILFESMLSV